MSWRWYQNMPAGEAIFEHFLGARQWAEAARFGETVATRALIGPLARASFPTDKLLDFWRVLSFDTVA